MEDITEQQRVGKSIPDLEVYKGKVKYGVRGKEVKQR
jgi:hypothetical protein